MPATPKFNNYFPLKRRITSRLKWTAVEVAGLTLWNPLLCSAIQFFRDLQIVIIEVHKGI